MRKQCVNVARHYDNIIALCRNENGYGNTESLDDYELGENKN